MNTQAYQTLSLEKQKINFSQCLLEINRVLSKYNPVTHPNLRDKEDFYLFNSNSIEECWQTSGTDFTLNDCVIKPTWWAHTGASRQTVWPLAVVYLVAGKQNGCKKTIEKKGEKIPLHPPQVKKYERCFHVGATHRHGNLGQLFADAVLHDTP